MPDPTPNRNPGGFSDAVLIALINTLIGAVVTVVLAYMSYRNTAAIDANNAQSAQQHEEVTHKLSAIRDAAQITAAKVEENTVAQTETTDAVKQIPEAAAVAADKLVESKTAPKPPGEER